MKLAIELSLTLIVQASLILAEAKPAQPWLVFDWETAKKCQGYYQCSL